MAECATIPSRRDEIIDASLRLFLRDGYAGTGIRAIAGDVGISEATIYHHFRSKEDIFQAIIDRVTAGQSRLIRDVPPGATLEEALLLIGRRFLEVMARPYPRDLTHLMIFESAHHPDVADRYLREVHEGGLDHITSVIESRVPSSSPVDAKTVARVFSAALTTHVLHDEMLASVAGRLGDDGLHPEREERLESVVKLIVAAANSGAGCHPDDSHSIR